MIIHPKDRSLRIEFEFERELQELLDEFGSEREEIRGSHARHKKEMLDILAQMEADFHEGENDARQEFEATREEIINSESYKARMREKYGEQSEERSPGESICSTVCSLKTSAAFW